MDFQGDRVDDAGGGEDPAATANGNPGSAAADEAATAREESRRGHAISSEEATSSQASDFLARGLKASRRKEPRIVEGRRCELCGRGSEPIEELTTAVADGPDSTIGRGGLGRLLGPLSDKLGVAAVWVHQECAVWSPEVYFLGVGCLKNVRAALRRGRFLKCSRCKLPGATIGCRVSRCPRTYHLPCARQSGCSFNHKRYLMSCAEHVKHFLLQDKKRLRMCMIDDQLMKKSVKENKAVENAEDEEFLKREKKRLQRDLARLAPVKLGGGGSSAQGDAFKYEGWESVGGLKNVVQCLKEMVTIPLLYPEIFQKVGIVPPRGVLLHGYPGTGKTLVVRALLGACARGEQKISYFSRKGADCLGKYVGDAERQLRLLFQLAEQSQPSIIFFDEIDGLAPKRSRNQDQTHSSVVSTLLALMDGLNPRGSVVVIGATNRPDSLDPALRRAGRFDREIFFPLPSVADREAILRVHTKSWKKMPSREVLSSVANSTIGFAGADLQALCAQAAMISLKRTVCLQDLLSLPDSKGTMSLPDIQVEVTDWFAALAQAGPPCSRRLLGSTLSELHISPLPRYLVPVLLRPVLSVLSHLDSDGRFSLPRQLRTPIALVKEKRLLNSATLWVRTILEELENACRGTGIISGDDLNAVDENGSTEVTLMKPLVNAWKADSLRILLFGSQRDGKSLVASSVLHIFQSCMQVFLLSLQTMIQAGSGELSDGLIQILSEARAVSSVVFMPKIESWALEEVCESSEEGNVSLVASRAWGTFLQHIRSLPSDLPIFFLATCEQPLPPDVSGFFTAPLSKINHTTASHACVEVPLPSESEVMEVLNRAADSFTAGLVTAKSNYAPTPEAAAEVSQLPGRAAKPFGGESHTTEPVKSLTKEPARQRSSSLDAIRCCGHQLLNSPHYMAIRQATSSLNAGPSLYLDNPYTGVWVAKDITKAAEIKKKTERETEKPAQNETNADNVNTNKAEDKAFELARGHALGPESDGDGSDDASRTIWGLDAVGLKAYRGHYSSASELVLELKTVIELLREKLDRKPRSGRSQWFRCHLLAQAGAVQDLIECWAHEQRRLESRDKKLRFQHAAPESSSRKTKSEQRLRSEGSNFASAAGKRRRVEGFSEQRCQDLRRPVAKLFEELWEREGRSVMVDDVHDLVNQAWTMILSEASRNVGSGSMIAVVDTVRRKCFARSTPNRDGQ